MGYHPWGHKEPDTTERLSTHHSADLLPLALSLGFQDWPGAGDAERTVSGAAPYPNEPLALSPPACTSSALTLHVEALEAEPATHPQGTVLAAPFPPGAS